MHKFHYHILSVICILSLLAGCTSPTKEVVQEIQAPKATLRVQSFDKMPDGTEVSLYTLKNKNGIEMSVMNYGGIITKLLVPDRNGNLEDVVLGYDSLSGYMKSNPYFGALIGRYGNRIAGGKFSIDGKQYKITTNDGPNHLHGGAFGFDKVYWTIEPQTDSSSLKMTYVSKNGEEGYPGTLTAEVIYILNDSNELVIDYKATTDAKTIVNLTQHSYFNLGGPESKDILRHKLLILADAYLPVDKTLIPTGEIRPVKNTPFDFLSGQEIGSRINEQDEQLKLGKGYDHCWVLNGEANKMRKVAELSDSTSGRVMEVFTTEPGIQFYSGNFLDGTLKGKQGKVYEFRTGLCLETQHYPDSPNKPAFPSVFLEPGVTYRTTTKYKFITR
jgi:aldose 1-epimerase